MRLEGKVAIVAGVAWGGIDAATAYRLPVRSLLILAIEWRNSKKPLIELRRRVVEAFSVVGDVSDKETWVALVGVALDNFGKVTTLVHNATHSYTKPAIEFTQE